MGLTISDAVRVFLTRVVADKELPFALKAPNETSRVAIAEGDQIFQGRRARFATADALLSNLKKSATTKRASLPRASDYTREFQKNWRRLSHSGRHDMNRLKDAMLFLVANEGPLLPEWLDHPLTGDWAHSGHIIV